MPVIPTDQWLKHYLKNKIGLMEYDLGLQRGLFGKNLSPHFSRTWHDEIHQHLLQNGMFLPDSSDEETIQMMCHKKVWKVAEDELNRLILDWNGPDIPVFIFPSNNNNEQLRIDLGGRSGLAHQDKMFLFISKDTSETDLQSLITHEYNHVCRLSYFNQVEKKMKLLDGMILEGLAEVAVFNRFGKDFSAKWTSIYPLDYALDQWETNMRTNLHIQKSNSLYNDFMYGNSTIPKWLGYNIGYHLVFSFAEVTGNKMNEILRLPSKTILEKSIFSIC